MFKKIIAFLMALTMLTGVALAANFNDFEASHWAYKFVDSLVADGTINGYEDGTFRPDANVTRAELAKLITAQFGADEKKVYTDVAEDAWYYEFVTNSGNYFLSEGEFLPSQYATREEVAYAIYAAKKFTGADSEASFTDAADITDAYSKAVATVADNGIITGYPDGTFLPKNNITRAETATVLYRAIHLGEETEEDSDKEETKEEKEVVLNEKVYLEVFKQTDLLLKPYSADTTITHGELSMAALRLYNNEWDVAYYNLGDVVNKKPFNHKDALAFWLIGRDVLGADVVTEAVIDTPISVGDAIKVLAYYSELHDYDRRTVDQEAVLKGVDRNEELTHKTFAQAITEIDTQIAMLVKTVFGSGNTAKKITTELRKDLDSYPSNANKYQVILEEIPNNVYEASYQMASASLTEKYSFAREMQSFLVRPLNEFCKIAAEKGAEFEISFYPSLVASKDDYYTMRVMLEVLSANDGLSLSDVCNTKLDRAISAGDKFFCDISSNAVIPSADISGAVLSIDNIIE